MAKTVKRLQEKHRDRVWRDGVGYIIFYSMPLNSWAMMSKPTLKHGASIQPLNVDDVSEHFGPFTAVTK